MSEELQVEVVDLGDAKEVTKGEIGLPNTENNPTFPMYLID